MKPDHALLESVDFIPQENWRNKILETQVRRQVKQYDLMNTMRHKDGYKSGLEALAVSKQLF